MDIGMITGNEGDAAPQNFGGGC